MALRSHAPASAVRASTARGSIVVVSNRLPVVLERDPRGGWVLKAGSGGLVTALQPVLRRDGGTWIGWPGVDVDGSGEVQEILDGRYEGRGYGVRAIGLSKQEQEDFYLGFSNQVVWPLFHGFPERCNFHPRFWDAYRTVNRKFARGVAEVLDGRELIWVQDYHLMGVADALRGMKVRQPIAFFLHTPFPALDVFRKLPWRLVLLRSLLRHDLIGFQTDRDREKFVHTLRCLVPDVEIEADGGLPTVRTDSRSVKLGVYPISIDADEFAEAAAKERVRQEARRIRQELVAHSGRDPDSHVGVLGVDRLDYTKGLTRKLRAFQQALRRHPELRGNVTLTQLVVPSREGIPEYDALKARIDGLVGEICGEFTDGGWSPIRYEYGRWSRSRLLAHYRAARVALVTPLQDGMNLVAKEFCAASIDDDGVLVLSEHAGAAAQLHADALLVNPYDLDQLTSAIHRSCTMDPAERWARMRRMREGIRRQDIHWWAESFLRDAQARGGRTPGRRIPRPSRFPEVR
jgi:trehalose 6-phosphate synthase/phosphatase